MFKNLFGKKKQPAPDPLNRTVRDLDQGYLFEYDLRSWEVKAVYEYDWGDNDFSKEFQVSDGTETFYLGVEDDDELEILWSSKISLAKIEAKVADHIIKHQSPPDTLVYAGKTYYLDEEAPGYFHEKGEPEDQWQEFISWDYYDDSEEYNLCIEQWGERSFEASQGKYLEEFEITDILPRNIQ